MIISMMLSSSFIFAPKNNTHKHPERTHKQQPRTLSSQASIKTVLTPEEYRYFCGRRNYALLLPSSYRQNADDLQTLSYVLTAVTAATYLCNFDPNISNGYTLATLISFCIKYQQERLDKQLTDESIQWFAKYFPSHKIQKLQKLDNLTPLDQQFIKRVAEIQSRQSLQQPHRIS